MKIIKKIWFLLCITGVPWFLTTVVAIHEILYQIYCNDPRGRFSPDTNMIIYLSLATSFLIMLRNLQHISAGDEVGLFTWMRPVDYQQDTASEKKKNAQNPKIPGELLSAKPEGLILGKYKNNFVRFYIKSGQIMHALILGSVGTGKSTLLITSLIGYLKERPQKTKSGNIGYAKPDVAMFVVDIKPELYNAATNKKYPYTRTINPENRKSFGWNVYYNINLNSPEDKIVEELDIIAKALIPEQKNSKNSFFSESGSNILVAILLYTFKKGMNFMEGLEYLMSDSLDNVLKEIMERVEGNPNYIRVKRTLTPYLGKKDNEGLQNIEMTIRQNLKPFLSDTFRWLLNDNPKKSSPLDLEKRISIFLCLKDSKMNSYSVLMRLITMQLVSHGTQRDSSSHALMYVIDESPRLGGKVLKELTNFMALSRSFNVSCILLAQSITQFYTELSQEETETLMEICRILGVLSCKSKKQADLLSSWAGTYFEKKTSYSHKSQKNINGYNTSYEEKPIINASDLMHLMDKKEILLFIDGNFYKANAEKARYYLIPEFKKISERNKHINGK